MKSNSQTSGIITGVLDKEDFYEVSFGDNYITLLKKKHGVVPKEGDMFTAHTTGGTFGPIRGMDLNGTPIFWKTDEELEAHCIKEQTKPPAEPCIDIFDLLELGFKESEKEKGLYVLGIHDLRFREKDGLALMRQWSGGTVVANGGAENMEQVKHMISNGVYVPPGPAHNPFVNGFERPSPSGRYA